VGGQRLQRKSFLSNIQVLKSENRCNRRFQCRNQVALSWYCCSNHFQEICNLLRCLKDSFATLTPVNKEDRTSAEGSHPIYLPTSSSSLSISSSLAWLVMLAQRPQPYCMRPCNFRLARQTIFQPEDLDFSSTSGICHRRGRILVLLSC
jgi:hypothetical protein